LHAGIRVVRPDPSFWQGVFGTGFRSHSTFNKEGDVQTETLWHELGHALDQLHIKALTGDQKRLVDINADDCYVTPKGMPPNVMGEGNSLSLWSTPNPGSNWLSSTPLCQGANGNRQ